MTEIAEHLVEALRLGGRRPPSSSPIACRRRRRTRSPNLVVAPHEFFVLFPASRGRPIASSGELRCASTPSSPARRSSTWRCAYCCAGPWRSTSTGSRSTPSAPLGVPRRAPAARLRAVDGSLARRRRRRRSARSTSRSSVDARRAERRSSAVRPGVLWEWRTDLRFFSWHRPPRADHRDVHARATAKYDALAVDADPAERPPRRRAVLRVGSRRRGDRQRMRRRVGAFESASRRSCPACTS